MYRTGIKNYSKDSLSLQYWTGVLINFVYTAAIAIVGVIAAVLSVIGITLMFNIAAPVWISLIVSIFLIIPLGVGVNKAYIKIYRRENTEARDILSGFNSYGRCLGGMLWMELWVYLWGLLFVIPGIIKAFSYAMTPYILADSPNVPATEAIKISMKMMRGYKGELFVFILSYIGWFLLDSLTSGILGIFYVTPYFRTACAGFYVERRRQSVESGIFTPQELHWLNS